MSTNEIAAALADRAQRAARYFHLRSNNPDAPAIKIFHWVRGDCDGDSLQEFLCPGHEWAYTGTQYGGDDESYHGEGRAYCVHCGKDGDA